MTSILVPLPTFHQRAELLVGDLVAENRYRVQSIPWVADGIALGDVVETVQVPVWERSLDSFSLIGTKESDPVFLRVAVRSGNTIFRIKSSRKDFAAWMERWTARSCVLQCRPDKNLVNRLYGLSVPRNINPNSIIEWLDQAKEDGVVLAWESPYWNEEWSTQI